MCSQRLRRGESNSAKFSKSFCCTPPRGCVEFRDFAGGAVSNREKNKHYQLLFMGAALLCDGKNLVKATVFDKRCA